MSLFSLQRTLSEAQINEAIEKLSPMAKQVVKAMTGGEYVRRISCTASEAGVNPTTVSKIMRYLRSIGLAEYGPLIDENYGHPNGSGTWLNDFGLVVQNRLLEQERQLQDG